MAIVGEGLGLHSSVHLDGNLFDYYRKEMDYLTPLSLNRQYIFFRASCTLRLYQL
jgi:hypothetical protein